MKGAVTEQFLAEFKSTDENQPDAPTPLIRNIPPGDPYPTSALGPLQPVVEAVNDIVQAPMAIGAQSALAVVSLAVQGQADVQTLIGRSPCSVFALTVALSGERKTSCDRLLMVPAQTNRPIPI